MSAEVCVQWESERRRKSEGERNDRHCRERGRARLCRPCAHLAKAGGVCEHHRVCNRQRAVGSRRAHRCTEGEGAYAGKVTSDWRHRRRQRSVDAVDGGGARSPCPFLMCGAALSLWTPPAAERTKKREKKASSAREHLLLSPSFTQGHTSIHTDSHKALLFPCLLHYVQFFNDLSSVREEDEGLDPRG